MKMDVSVRLAIARRVPRGWSPHPSPPHGPFQHCPIVWSDGPGSLDQELCYSHRLAVLSAQWRWEVPSAATFLQSKWLISLLVATQQPVFHRSSEPENGLISSRNRNQRHWTFGNHMHGGVALIPLIDLDSVCYCDSNGGRNWVCSVAGMQRDNPLFSFLESNYGIQLSWIPTIIIHGSLSTFCCQL